MTDGIDQTQAAADAAQRANSFPWPPLLFVAAVAGAWVCGDYFPLAWPGVNDNAARVIGLSIGAAGFVLIAWAILTLRAHDTTVMPHGVSSVLVTSGPYGRFRNPIYLGEAMAMLGVAEATKNIWFVIFAVVFALLITWLQIIPEERHLAARFGEDYADYKARARRWF